MAGGPRAIAPDQASSQVTAHDAIREGGAMGDKSPKSKDKAKKQQAVSNQQAKAAHDKKQAPPTPGIGKAKGR
jgi:hypothetical protein